MVLGVNCSPEEQYAFQISEDEVEQVATGALSPQLRWKLAEKDVTLT